MPSERVESVTLTKPVILAPRSYYTGIIGYNNRQSLVVSEWTLERRQPEYTTHFDLSFQNMRNHFSYYGMANGANFVQVRTAGLVVHRKPFWAHKGFSTTFDWEPNCAQTPQVKGFSFFLSKNLFTATTVLKSDPTTGQYGTASLSSVVSVSYNREENAFYAYFG